MEMVSSILPQLHLDLLDVYGLFSEAASKEVAFLYNRTHTDIFSFYPGAFPLLQTNARILFIPFSYLWIQYDYAYFQVANAN